MKKLSVIGLILVFFLSFTITTTASAKKITWKMNFYAMTPDEEPGAKKIVELALPAIKKRTNGNFEIKTYWGEELGLKAFTYPQALLKNVVQLVWTFAGYYESEIPVTGVNGLPFLITSEAEYKKFSQEIFWKYFPKGVEKAYKGKITAIGGQPYNWGETVTSKPAPSNTDWTGLKIRAPAPDGAKLFDLLGGTGVVISWAEMMPALQQGTIDGITTSFASLTKGKFFELCKHVYLMNHVMSESSVLASTAALNKLPDDYKTILYEEFEKAGNAVYDDLIPDNRGQKEAIQIWVDNGATIHKYSMEEIAEVRNKAKPLWEKVYKKDELTKACMDEYYKVFGNPFK